MIIYCIGTFDTQTKKITNILCLPERRYDQKRITKASIDRWIRSIMGSQWWSEYWARVSTVTKRVD